MRYADFTKPQNKKILSLLEREDKQAGAPSNKPVVQGSVSAGVGAAAPVTVKPAVKAKGTVSGNVGVGLTKAQQVEAALVGKLPSDFPIDQWESMNTKAQLKAMQHSGLNDQEQWVLLNATAPLSVLDQHNQTLDEIAIKAYVTRSLAPVYSAVMTQSGQRTQASDSKTSNSTPLQTDAQQRKLDMRQEEYETRILEKAATRADKTEKATADKKAFPPLKAFERETLPKDSDGDDGKKETWIDKLATLWDNVVDFFAPEKSTPQTVTIETVPPSITPRITPTPSPKPKPTPTPRPTPSLSEQRAQAAVDKGMKYADEGIRYEWGSKNIETGAVDCSGFIVTLLTGAGFKFGQGNLSLGAQYMANSFLVKQLGTEEYNYSKNKNIPPLQAGDLVFSADADNPKVNKHVMMVTGNGMQVVEASSVTGVNKVTYQFDAYKTEKNGRYFRDSGQIITQVIRPKY